MIDCSTIFVFQSTFHLSYKQPPPPPPPPPPQQKNNNIHDGHASCTFASYTVRCMGVSLCSRNTCVCVCVYCLGGLCAFLIIILFHLFQFMQRNLTFVSNAKTNFYFISYMFFVSVWRHEHRWVAYWKYTWENKCCDFIEVANKQCYYKIVTRDSTLCSFLCA